MIAVKILNDIIKPEHIQPQHGADCGVDLRATETIEIPSGERRLFGTGIAIQPMMGGYAGFIYSRSGLGSKGLAVANGVGVIDPEYTGELKAMLHNTSGESWTVNAGDRIAQLVIQPYLRWSPVIVDELGKTNRGDNGFGSTGVE